jgi:hypothetical protein
MLADHAIVVTTSTAISGIRRQSTCRQRQLEWGNPSGNCGREWFSAAHEWARLFRDSGVGFCSPESALSIQEGKR